MLVLASGENMVPGPLENVLMSSPLVGGLVFFGAGRNQVGVLIEPSAAAGDAGKIEFIRRIW